MRGCALLCLLTICLGSRYGAAQLVPGDVVAEQQLSALAGGLTGGPAPADMFGASLTTITDLDANGVDELVVGAPTTGGPFAAYGSVWIVNLAADGTAQGQLTISAGVGGLVAEPILLGGVLPASAGFGTAVASLGDLDGDGVDDIAVGALAAQDGAVTVDTGVVWVLFLDATGAVKAQQRIDGANGGFSGSLSPGDRFGAGLASLGDLDGDGITELAVGAPGDDDGGASLFGRGAVWILFLDTDGTVQAEQKISATVGGFGGTLADDDLFGESLASLGNLGGGGVSQLAVGAPSVSEEGALWIIDLATNGTVLAEQRIDHLVGGFGGALSPGDQFGSSLARLGDLDGDAIGELAVGARGASGGGIGRGSVWILFLDQNGAVDDEHRIDSTSGDLSGPLVDGDAFGWGLASLADLDGDQREDLVVGAPFTGADVSGAAWVLFLQDPWIDHGFAHAGVFGDPSLTADGTLIASDPASLTLSNANPLSLTMFVLGILNISVPLKGGVLVPSPDVMIALASDAQGSLFIPTLWPGGIPSGLLFYVQYWIQDPAASAGFSASNALQGTTP